MENPAITFTGANKIEVIEEELHLGALQPREVLIQSLYTVISPGTELACLSGGEWWFPFPGVPGYCSVGTLLAAGDAVKGLAAGDTVFSYGRHQRINRLSLDRPVLKVPAGIDLKLVPLTHIATIAFTAIRVSDIELGDDVAVIGLGLVGNIAAQLASLQGGRVIGIDLSDGRIALARACGLELAINPSREDTSARVKQLTDGAGVHTLIDATGHAGVIRDSLPWIGRLGELVLLGTPRGEVPGDLTDLLNYSHMWPRGSITFKGAHEWRYPVYRDPFVKHSLERNSRLIWRLQQEGRLALGKLITHVIKPEEAPAAYDALRTQKDNILGVVIDWTG